LAVPAGIRPSGGKLREALFSIWTEEIAGARFLDLFAGSGAVGLEAWSRGAREVALVERQPAALRAARRNVEMVPERREVRLLAGSVAVELERLAAAAERFDLIFADPPYDEVPDRAFFARVAAVAEPDGQLAVEHRAGVDPGESPPGWRRRSSRRYGDSALSIYERESE
jgi:16S rRNA (guanine966-N2)-methyltransferase